MSTTRLLKSVDKHIFGMTRHLYRVSEKERQDIQKKKESILKRRDLKIAFIKLWAIGDAVNTLPMIKSVKERYPSCSITIITKKSLEPIYNHQSFINKIIKTDTENIFQVAGIVKAYDIVFDLEPHLEVSANIAGYSGKIRIGFANQTRSETYHYTVPFRKDQHIVKTYTDMLEHIGIKKDIDSLVPLAYSSKAKKNTDTILTTYGIRKNYMLIGFCAGVGASVKEREWPKERFKELAKKILDKKSKNVKIILIGAKEDNELCKYIKDDNQDIINLSGKFSLEELFCVIKKTRIFVSNDTGPMHIAAAQGCRTIGLFGPNTPAIWRPYGKYRRGEKNISIFHPKKGCPFLDNTKPELVPENLTKEQRTCMDAISVDEVYRAVRKML
jgi:ADP-heptose:LPS heptosyltransferase